MSSQSLTDDLARSAQDLGETVNQAVGKATDKLVKRTRDLSASTSDLLDQELDRLKDGSDLVAKRAAGYARTVEKQIKKRPMLAAATAAGVGLVVGGLLIRAFTPSRT